MAQKTLIGGTGYSIKNGCTQIDGTNYSIKKGKTLINGTGYNIYLSQYTFTQMNDNYIGDQVKSVVWERTSDGLVCIAQVDITANVNNRLNCGYWVNGVKPGDTITVTWSLDSIPSGSFYIDIIFADVAKVLDSHIEGYSHITTTLTLTSGDHLNIYAAIGRAGAYTTTLVIHSIKVNGEEILT